MHVPWKNSERNNCSNYYGNSYGRNSSAVSLTRFRSPCLDFSYGTVSDGTVSDGRLSYGSVVYSIRRYHVHCVCHEGAWAAPAALPSAPVLLERHFSTWHLLPARYTYRATRQHFSTTAKQRSTGFLKQGKYTGFLKQGKYTGFLKQGKDTGFLIWPFSTSFLNYG